MKPDCVFSKGGGGGYCFWLQHYFLKSQLFSYKNSQQIMSHTAEFCDFSENYFLTAIYLSNFKILFKLVCLDNVRQLLPWVLRANHSVLAE